MKTAIAVLFALILTLVTENSFSWDSTLAKFYPLKVGNSWTYRGQGTFPGPCWTREKRTVTGTNVVNGHLYYVVHYISQYNPPGDFYVRVDSTTMNVMLYGAGCPWSPTEAISDSLGSRYRDSFIVNCNKIWKLMDTTSQSVLGFNRATRMFSWTDNFEQTAGRKLSIGFGLTEWSTCGGGTGCCVKTLVGCVIDGVQYGDTSLTGIIPPEGEVPREYSLYQNYPNPFNPVTNIKFDIPAVGGNSVPVKIAVYSLLGEEIVVLADNQMQPGSYEVSFDASMYSSGVYFYKLQAGEYIDVKKMILVK
mgnify:CR=1 FL=1